MKALWFLLIGLLVGLCAASLLYFSNVHKQPRSRLFVSDGGLGAAFDRMGDIRNSCPQAAFVSTKEESEYSLGMAWEKDHWWSALSGNDQVLLVEESPDFNKIVRDACKAIQKDEDWPIRAARPRENKSVLLDRYELREVRNGNVVTSALLDKQTGKVWIWSTGKNGSAFMAEDVIPAPDTQ